tara:strand:- start:746 stop:1216 length:471 start_codon:yes stop_codon:yes gene_type:complete
MASQVEIATKLGINASTFKDLVARGVVETRGQGQYNYEEVSKQYLDHLREVAAGRFSGNLELGAERARLAKEQADAKEMENAIGRGELVHIEKIAVEYEKQLTKLRTRLLALPNKVAPEAHACSTAKDVQALIETNIVEALNELVGYGQEIPIEET